MSVPHTHRFKTNSTRTKRVCKLCNQVQYKVKGKWTSRARQLRESPRTTAAKRRQPMKPKNDHWFYK